ncbi:MAG: hypothetical protein Ct9H300mP28_31570 [Pseudomonadota bacterium]|nr:MAG: hypothetical protein Ct9H300mP28_31570 [Pseudomonadota bacterium]
MAELETEGAEKRHHQLAESSGKNRIPKTHARLGFVTPSLEDTWSCSDRLSPHWKAKRTRQSGM